MKTDKFLFHCKIGVAHDNKIFVLGRRIAIVNDADTEDSYHYESFDEANKADQYETDGMEAIGYYDCEVYLVYETIEYAGGQDGTEYNCYLEFGELKIIAN